MSIDHFRPFAAYNHWANRRLYGAALAMPDEPYRRPTGVFFGSLHGTLNHPIGQRRLASQSGSTPHERGHHVSHPHRQARFPLVTIRPRRRSTGQIAGGVFNKAIFPESHRHRGSSEPETHQRPPSPDGCALASCVGRQRRDQIAIAPESPSARHLPRVPSLEAFGRRPRCKPNRRDGPSSETLRRGGCGRLMAQPVYPQLRKYPRVQATYVWCQKRT